MTDKNENVAILIVSHSPDIARGTMAMAKQMSGEHVRLGWTGGNSDGALGTNLEDISKGIDVLWTESGVAVLVDLGGAEMNTEIAIENLPEYRRQKVVLCNAPIVEGAIMAATEASIGSSLTDVCAAAELSTD